jgi:hypothetical protein
MPSTARLIIVFLLFSFFVLSITSHGRASTSTTRGGARNKQNEQNNQRNANADTKGRKATTKSEKLPANYYDRLGINKKATENEIKKAYRKLAVKVSNIIYFIYHIIFHVRILIVCINLLSIIQIRILTTKKKVRRSSNKLRKLMKY